ncbi:protein-S-isoprenylcysteine O-methyltransferase Ste14 [Mumia flava]|uniref:Protein-S-isoprenylcysteine O-methyltransferase Ste14 n=1 Tax=Mumia flava TaxID=1348852 RepID=A0A0B2BFD8_9ACTN|nr:isoprenylcysteine carboxylmethyltransferase family protein [Mumia flava]PJJ57173.1 protein-S-isoprenylcysteine O-methyltransferase Ste14 [Mumia flava]
MRPAASRIGSAAFFLAAPGTTAGLIPWVITGWSMPDDGTLRTASVAVGSAVVVVGLVPVVDAFVRFARAGGTPMPAAPTERLVVDGFNRWMRNPMYAGVTLVIAGQALVFGSWAVLAYAGLFWAVTASFVRWYEEPTLLRTYGEAYRRYREAVPAWWPRRRRRSVTTQPNQP